MTATIFVVLVLGTGLLTAYTQRFQKATLALGKQLAGNDPLLPTGLQDAITPKTQTLRNILMFISILIVLTYGVVFYAWYFGLAFALGTVFVVSPIVSQFLPKIGSDYYRHRIRKELLNRQAKYRQAGDTMRESAVAHIVSCLDKEEPITMSAASDVVKEAMVEWLKDAKK